MIIHHDIRLSSMEVIVTDSLDGVFLRVGTLCISSISIKVSLVGMFRSYFKLLMKANLDLVNILARVIIIH